MQERAMREDGESYLSGSTIAPWTAVSLRGLWTEPEIALFLKTGANAHAAAYGSMTEVVHGRTQYFTDDDLNASRAFLEIACEGRSAKAAAPAEVPS
jgi:hypothetical protein